MTRLSIINGLIIGAQDAQRTSTSIMGRFSETVKGGSDGLGGEWLTAVAFGLFLLETLSDTRASDVVNLEPLERL